MPVVQRRAGGLSPEYALLGFLDQAPAHGYELHDKLIDHLGEIWHVSLSQTYNILARLETQGFIQGELWAQESRPAKRLFHLTTAGQERFEGWLSAVSSCSVRGVRVEFVTRLFFLYARHPAQAWSALEAQSRALQMTIAGLKEREQKMDASRPFNILGNSLRIRQLEALAASLHECEAWISLDSRRQT